jgi:hypothetical protein
MRFVRFIFSLAQNDVQPELDTRVFVLTCVVEQDVPFGDKDGIRGVGVETMVRDVGCVLGDRWVDDAGNPCSLSQLLFSRLSHVGPRMVTEELLKEALPDKLAAWVSEECKVRLIASPCTLNNIRAAIREGGIEAIPVLVRAWLTAILPDDQVRELAVWQRVPLSALGAMERLRQKRDPDGGSRVFVTERRIQQESNARSAIALARRHAAHEAKWKPAADSAWREMTDAIKANLVESVSSEAPSQSADPNPASEAQRRRTIAEVFNGPFGGILGG